MATESPSLFRNASPRYFLCHVLVQSVNLAQMGEAHLNIAATSFWLKQLGPWDCKKGLRSR